MSDILKKLYIERDDDKSFHVVSKVSGHKKHVQVGESLEWCILNELFEEGHICQEQPTSRIG